MLSKTAFSKVSTLLQPLKASFAFKKFDFEDGLNLKSLLTEEELLVR